MKIKKKAKGRINAINDTIEKLLVERQKITEEITKDLVNWLILKNALVHDYDTLVGGIFSVITMIEQNDDDANVQKERWKQVGSKIKTHK
jgi:uncharacterized protein YutE (UPF0331/DUF86 family)